MQIKIVNQQFSQTIDTGGSNQSEISSEIIRGGIPAQSSRHVEQHDEPRHEDVENSSSAAAAEHAAEPPALVDIVDERANLISKLNSVIENPATPLAELQKLVEDVS